MKNRFEIRGDVVAIELRRKAGEPLHALIDICDLPVADSIKGRWYASWEPKCKTFYVKTNVYSRKNGKPSYQAIKLHRLIMQPPAEQEVDHRNHDGLNNRRRNLRVVSLSENRLNIRGAGWRSLTGQRGASLEPTTGKYRARVVIDKKEIYLGLFPTAVQASARVKEFLAQKANT